MALDIYFSDKKPYEVDTGHFDDVDHTEHAFLFFNEFNIKTVFEYAEAGEKRETYDNYLLEQYAKLQENFPLISRVKDYYEDAVFSKDEISELSREIKQLQIFAKHLPSKNFLKQISTACQTAQKNKIGIVFIAD